MPGLALGGAGGGAGGGGGPDYHRVRLGAVVEHGHVVLAARVRSAAGTGGAAAPPKAGRKVAEGIGVKDGADVIHAA